MRFITALVFILNPLFAFCQLMVNNLQTPQQLVQNVLLGPGIPATNITYSGAQDAIGYFTYTDINPLSDMGIKKGLLMTSGGINNAVGPNYVENKTAVNFTSSDPDATAISAYPGYTKTSKDAAILEFDYIPITDTIRFRYVFASEEYPEMVNENVNDVFGVFVSGPGISGPYTNSAKNYAIVPGTTGTAVTVKTVNASVNSTQYRVNSPGSPMIQYDGMTKVFTAVIPVDTCQTYHFKFVIADGGDYAYDSGVFIEAFYSNLITVSASGGGVDSTEILNVPEGCFASIIKFSMQEPKDTNETFNYILTGSAKHGIDYQITPYDSLHRVTIFAGERFAYLYVEVFADDSLEQLETATFTYGKIFCSSDYRSSANINIIDVVPFHIVPSPERKMCLGDSILMSATTTGGYGTPYFAWPDNMGMNIGDSTFFKVSPDSSHSYVLNVGDSCGNYKQYSFDIEVYTVPSTEFGIQGDGCHKNIQQVMWTGTHPVPVEFIWDFDGAEVVSGSGPGPYELRWNEPGKKNISLIVDNGVCIPDTNIITYEISPCLVDVPNILTRNDDDINDFLTIKNIQNYPNSKIFIYNRWGKKVFQSDDYKDNFDAVGLEDGVYYYVLYVTNEDKTVLTGTVTVTGSQ